jgi:superoxide dismutase, Fe-Mn family
MITRRQALKKTALATVACAAGSTLRSAIAQPAPAPAATASPAGPFTLPPLPYAYDALEPHIDAQTMQIHHDKHHAAYVANLNKAWAQFSWGGPAPDLSRISGDAYDLYLEHNWLNDAKVLSENPAIRNNGGGHFNHSLFWQMMKKDGGGEPKGELSKAIETSFGNFTDFKTKFTEAATKVFGSGWVWLVLKNKDDRGVIHYPDYNRNFAILTMPNQDNPISQGTVPLLGLDVWEHAYYLKYQNKRADYIAAWWNVVNWDFVAGRHAMNTGTVLRNDGSN